jgi:quinolinate synthase
MKIQGNTVNEVFKAMKESLGHIVPEFELKLKAELVYEINRLKLEKKAVILGHNYMEPALYHTVTDFVGDSLQLSREAAETSAERIIFCGVKFMAETAKVLSPDKIVLLPSLKAGCSLAGSITAQDVIELKNRFTGAPVVTYVNTYADVKGETDICCTSSNAELIVNSLKDQVIIFIPDQYLAENVAAETGCVLYFPDEPETKFNEAKKAGKKILVGWRGTCEVHEQFTVSDIDNARKQYPDITILAHPECPREIVELADFAGSTSRMIKYVKENAKPKFLLLTECSMGDNIVAENPDKELVRMCSIRCPHMNQITLEDTLASLIHDQFEIEVDPVLSAKARKSLINMIGIG